MGLKKKNHTIEAIRLTLPTAYAAVRNLYLHGEKCVAEFAIQTSRELAIDGAVKPLEVVAVEFDYIRGEDLVAKAYTVAKREDVVQRNGKTIRHPRPFFGWQDDIPTA